ncbi:hypothetical protein IWQ62_000023 [Dispira parvispora]|uniref:Histidinol-phosphatase n=1 Tax=Dispira parvispora TaxID=1520584 RepID=A0A9W8AVM1_9FUNG|nr:hypothetical protein IWQ62_000023 [Dispira parvispora]
MPVTLHSHSGQFCRHAHGNLEEVVRTARRKGFRVLGLSEHVPRYRTQDLYEEEVSLCGMPDVQGTSASDLTPEDLVNIFDEYVATAKRLRAQYQDDQFTILVGAETDYINEESLSKAVQLRQHHHLDYLVGSVHHLREIPLDFSQALYNQLLATCGGDLEVLFGEYFDAQFHMLQALKPEVVGHFDLCRLFAPRQHPLCHTLTPELQAKVCRNIDYVQSYGGMVEINSRAYKKNLPRAYPQPDILRIILAKGGRLTLSDDSHGPDDVALHYSVVREYLDEMGVNKVAYPLPCKEKQPANEISTVPVAWVDDVISHPFWSGLL